MSPDHTSPPLFARRCGPAGARTIVFLHGGGCGGWMWAPVMDRLAEFDCIAPDLPEHGQSRAVKPFTMRLAAEKTAELIRAQASGGRATVVGLSEGAQVAVQLLADAPELVERAVISSALVRPLPGAKWLTPGVFAWTYRLFIAPFKTWDFWIRLNMKYSAGLPEQYFAQFKEEFRSMSESGFTNLMTANQRFRLPAGLEQAGAPTLVIAGEKEYAAMKQSARDLAAALPNARLAWLSLGPKAALAQEHNWALTAPDLFAQTVRAWIDGTPLPDSLHLYS
ncbi:MAG: alpha/beta hydrolase [Chloroflexi bacterium]|nr:alpha/beta hydrolase [Chloroflexota bacterium]